MPNARRARGVLLRLVRNRKQSTALGLALLMPSAWVEFAGGDFPWWSQGLALVGGASGIALLWTGLFGLGPDWIESDEIDPERPAPPK